MVWPRSERDCSESILVARVGTGLSLQLCHYDLSGGRHTIAGARLSYAGESTGSRLAVSGSEEQFAALALAPVDIEARANPGLRGRLEDHGDRLRVASCSRAHNRTFERRG